MADYFLGVDGGGTHCRARIRDAAGRELGRGEGGLANVYQDFSSALANVLAAAEAAAAQAGLALRDLHAGLGLAGATGPEQRARVAGAGLPFASLVVDSDGCAACLGAHAGADGAIVIAGTGSAGFALLAERRLSIGGHGFVLGDQGSGAVIGREALKRALLAHDGLVAMSPLAEALLARFGHDPGRAIEWSRAALSRDYAAFAPLALEGARAGDPMAGAIVDEAAGAIAALARRLRAEGAARISLIGGLGGALAPFLPMDAQALFSPALADPVDGAILMARNSLAL